MRESYSLRDGDNIIAIAFLMRNVLVEHDSWWLNRIQVQYTRRHEGYGTALMKHILIDADTEGVELLLGVEPDRRGAFGMLVSWYRRFGFKPTARRITQYHNVMVRKPVKHDV